MRSLQKRRKKAVPIASACKKTMYDSLEDANEAIAHIVNTSWVKDLSAYQCKICGKWHLTSK